MIRVLIDQGLPLSLTSTLKELGWDAVHVREFGMKSAPDEEIIALAARESRVCITLDRDFPQAIA